MRAENFTIAEKSLLCLILLVLSWHSQLHIAGDIGVIHSIAMIIKMLSQELADCAIHAC